MNPGTEGRLFYYCNDSETQPPSATGRNRTLAEILRLEEASIFFATACSFSPAFCACLFGTNLSAMKKPSETTRHINPPTRSPLAPLALRAAAAMLFLALAAAANAQMASSADKAKERYQQRLAAAEKLKNDGVAKLTASYDAEVKLAREEVKKAFDPLIKAAAMRNQTEEVRNLTLQMESVVNPDGVSMPSGDSSTATGKDFRELLGVWETTGEDGSPGSLKTFEFKNPRTVVYSYSYDTSGGGKYSSTEVWKATTKPDKIIIEDSRRYAGNYKHWYEIKIPFDPNAVEITSFSEEGSGAKRSSSFRLTRKK